MSTTNLKNVQDLTGYAFLQHVIKRKDFCEEDLSLVLNDTNTSMSKKIEAFREYVRSLSNSFIGAYATYKSGHHNDFLKAILE